jgi:hypothetical protein
VQHALEGQQGRDHDRAGRGDGPITDHRVGAQGIDQERRHDGGHRMIALLLLLVLLEEHKSPSVRQGDGGEGPAAQRLAEQRRDPAQEAGQGIGPNAGGTAALGRLAGAPAALYPDQEADRQGHSQTLELFHGHVGFS